MKFTDAFDDAGQRLLGVRGAGEVGLDVVGDRGVLALANVLANVRHPLLDAARHVVPAVRHATYYGREVALAMLWILACTSCEHVSDQTTIKDILYKIYKS